MMIGDTPATPTCLERQAAIEQRSGRVEDAKREFPQPSVGCHLVDFREGWVRIMYMYVDGFSSWFSPVFFILVVGFGGFFMTNLFFAVM